MTINELEQAIRNLIASQPEISSGSNSGVINSTLSLIYSYRELAYKVQNHPEKDALKVNMTNQCMGLESALVISVCQVMQERGINLMLYAPTSQFGINSYGGTAFGSETKNWAHQNVSFVQNNTSAQSSDFLDLSEQKAKEDYEDLSKVFSDEEPEEESEILSEPEENVEEYNSGSLEPEIDNNSKEPELQSENAEPAVQSQEEKNEPNSPVGKASGRDYLLELLRK